MPKAPISASVATAAAGTAAFRSFSAASLTPEKNCCAVGSSMSSVSLHSLDASVALTGYG